MTTTELLALDPVIPVVVIEDADHAVPLARALVAGGLRTIEVTLRTPAALDAIERIAAEVPEIAVGAGTITSTAHVSAAHAAGASFLVSPGTTPRVLDELLACGLPFLPGVASASDVMALLERGITAAKLFPAEVVGGVALLQALGGPFPDVRFCPTGGITAASAPEYLQLKNVACVGGTWIARGPLPHDGDWSRITALARAAAELPR